MNDREYFVNLCMANVKLAQLSLSAANQSLHEGFKKLQAEYDGIVKSLEFLLEEAVLNRRLKTEEKDFDLADLGIRRAQMNLDTGKLKAQADLENGYNNLKLEVDRKGGYLEKEKMYLQYAEAQKERGFDL